MIIINVIISLSKLEFRSRLRSKVFNLGNMSFIQEFKRNYKTIQDDAGVFWTLQDYT